MIGVAPAFLNQLGDKFHVVMESYKLAQRLGKGAQGSVFLVEAKEDGKKYVLKKMECKDEAEANKAFKEAMALQELAHPYICGYREFFVSWDREEGALFVCIVMDYYPLGDLEICLRKKRENKEKFDELVLKKWIGQIIDAMTFVHEKGVIHRDLKPSNIFMKSTIDICIGDFGVATVMGDARTKTRTMVGSMNWMAPEVLERPYDERSDCWSMGCIILEMATTATHDANEIASILVQIKHSPQVLEEALKLVGEQYESELCGVIRTMLRRNFKQRPTALELKQMQYVNHCIALSKSKPGDAGVYNGVEEYEAVPKGKSIDMLFDYVEKYKEVQGAMVDSLAHLTEITRDEKIELTDEQKSQITTVMKLHMGDEKVLIAAIELLQNLVVTTEPDDILIQRQTIAPVLHAMRNHSNSPHLQAVASALLMAMAADDVAAQEIGEEGGVQDVLAALRAYPNDPVIGSNCCGALWILAVCDANTAILTEECGLQDICNAMKTHKDIEELVENACSALWSLSMEDENIEIMRDENVISMLVAAIKQHIKAPKVVKNACTTIGGIIYADEMCGLQLLSDDQSIPTILDAFKKHSSNQEVVESMCELMLTMGESEELAAELASYPVVKMLQKAMAEFPCIEDIVQKSEDAIQALNAVTGV
ncbi:hypothetical protein ACHWQZ_G010537 [Mnemiopsis leidyi]